jgi:hypothetical protein
MKNQLITSIYGDPENPTSALLEDWWDKTEAWAVALGVPPNELSAKFEQKPKGVVACHGYNLTKYRNRFQKELEANNIHSLDLTTLMCEWKYKALDWDFEAMFGQDESAGMIFAIGIDLEKLHFNSRLSPLIFVADAMHQSGRYLSAQYGFAVSMPRNFMAGGYALGVAAEMPDEMVYDTNAWSRFSGKECGRTLRNVYGYNILNSKHLDIDVGGTRLEDWIKSGGGRRGRIEPLDVSLSRGESPLGMAPIDRSQKAGSAGGLFLWTFQEGDDQEKFLWWNYPRVVAVREELKRFKIFPWQRLFEEE